MESVMLELNEGYAWDHYVHSLAEVLATCIFLWDHLITLDSEIQHIWMRPKSRSSIIFLAFRYYTLASVISVQMIFAFCPLDEKVLLWFIVCYAQMLILCRGAWFSPFIVKSYSSYPRVQFAARLFLDLLLALRVYAIYSADRRIAWLFIAAMLIMGGLTGFSLIGQDKIHYPMQRGCHIGTSHQTSLRISAPWTALFVYDAIIFGLTASHTYQFWREAQSNQLPVRQCRRLFSLLFRDGTIYFALIALANLVNILTFHFCGPFMSGGLASFASCISATMLCRLILNLHTMADTELCTIPDTVTWVVETVDVDLDEE
uniref:DUF6533 domain-containing protein n=1 Tax=Moniliophthora roreri TaxID=221103 RepID=A0A0W0FSN8_MONRR